ncbi:hypothetical protein ACFSHP_13085 [Novosphingobium panipatense]
MIWLLPLKRFLIWMETGRWSAPPPPNRGRLRKARRADTKKAGQSPAFSSQSLWDHFKKKWRE